jgi:hypothetical protein
MNDYEIFLSLESRLKAELESVKDAGRNYFSRNDFKKAEKFATRAGEIEKLQAKIQECKRLWNVLFGVDSSKEKRKKSFTHTVPRGTVTPQNKFRIVLLESLVELGGSAKCSEVIERVGKKTRSSLTKNDLDYVPSRKEVRWQNAIRWERNNCVDGGLMKEDSLRGTWEISEKGREYLQENSR